MSGALKGIIFDLDGTLVDSLHDIATGINLARRDFGLAPLAETEITRRVGDGSAALVRATVPVPEPQASRALERYLSHYAEHVLDTTRLFPGIADLLQRLVGRRLGVVTNKNAGLAETVISGLGIRDRFDAVLGGDSLSTKKPDPQPIVHLMARWHLQPHEVGLVGDGIHDIEAGFAAGVITIGVSWGVAGRAALAARGATHLADTVPELERLLLSLP